MFSVIWCHQLKFIIKKLKVKIQLNLNNVLQCKDMNTPSAKRKRQIGTYCVHCVRGTLVLRLGRGQFSSVKGASLLTCIGDCHCRLTLAARCVHTLIYLVFTSSSSSLTKIHTRPNSITSAWKTHVGNKIQNRQVHNISN